MKFHVLFEYNKEAAAYSVVCPEFPGCASAAATEEEARRNITEAIELYLEPTEIRVPANAKLDEVTVG